MCGICGQINLTRDEPVDPEMIRRMARTMIHRGPDDEGFFVAGPVGLGFRRLSIIDLAGGHQPMSDAAESVWVVFNGEIYNFKELRAQLEGCGHQFRTNSDTEVIVHGYKQWGNQVFQHLNGMFGVAVWDVHQRRLLIARDAMGIKLIYYQIAGGRLSFGSEIRPVLAAEPARPGVDPTAVSLFLQYRYTPAPLTIFQGMRKLAAGTMLVIESGACREERWYDFQPAPPAKPVSDAVAAAELLELYRGAVRRHLLSDVPVGILLSGGLDSGLLLALMNEQGANWPSYTVGYGPQFKDDELAEAAETAALLGSPHVTVTLDQAEFARALPGIVACLEEPVAASSIVPMYFVCQRARQDVKVVLLGQGPDELFGGYKRHLGVRYGGCWRQLPAGLRSLAGALIARLPRSETLKRGVYSLAVEDRLLRYQDVFSLLPAPVVRSLFRPDCLPREPAGELSEYLRPLLRQMENLDELGGFQLLEIRSSLPDELLMYADKLSMAHSLEARVPYLDRTIVEYAHGLGAALKIRRGTQKWLHRRLCRQLLPPVILRRKKRGFAVNVVDGWFNSSVRGPLSDLLRDPSSRMYEWLTPDPVQKLLADHRSGRQDNHKLLFSLVMFEQWLRGRAAV
jgi:asparagine synthase (glutamine-hydrolysing)